MSKEKWFRGQVSRRRPLAINHLERALGEVTSNAEADIVFENFYDAAMSATSDDVFPDFYMGMPKNDALSIPQNYEGTPNPEKVRKARELRDDLRESVIVPELGNPNYVKKKIRARQAEFGKLREFYEKERGEVSD